MVPSKSVKSTKVRLRLLGLLECVLGSLVGLLLGALGTVTTEARIVPCGLEHACGVRALLLSGHLANLHSDLRWSSECHDLGRSVLGVVASVGSVITSPRLLVLGCLLAGEDNKLGLVLTKALLVGLLTSNRAVAAAGVHSDAQ